MFSFFKTKPVAYYSPDPEVLLDDPSSKVKAKPYIVANATVFYHIYVGSDNLSAAGGYHAIEATRKMLKELRTEEARTNARKLHLETKLIARSFEEGLKT